MIDRRFLLVLLLLTLSASAFGCEHREPRQTGIHRPYLETDVTVRNPRDGAALAGTMTLPASTGSYPAVLLIAGSGPHNRDEEVFGHRPFFVLADYLTRLGMAVLRMDKRGCGQSGGTYVPYDIDTFISDAQAAITFLKECEQIDSTRIGVIGHSQGGLIAPMLARRSNDVAFIVLIAGPGKWGAEFFCSQAVAIAGAAGFGEPDFKRIRELYERLDPIWTKSGISRSEEREGREIIEELCRYMDADSRKILCPSDAAALLSFLRSWNLRSFLDYDPAVTLRDVRCPVLALNGDRDVQVPSRENLGAIENALRAGSNENYSVVEIQGLNHLLQECRTGLVSEYSTIRESVSPVALGVIGDWLVDVAKIASTGD